MTAKAELDLGVMFTTQSVHNLIIMAQGWSG